MTDLARSFEAVQAALNEMVRQCRNDPDPEWRLAYRNRLKSTAESFDGERKAHLKWAGRFRLIVIMLSGCVALNLQSLAFAILMDNLLAMMLGAIGAMFIGFQLPPLLKDIAENRDYAARAERIRDTALYALCSDGAEEGTA